MRVRCPNCSHPIELVDDREFDDLSCPSCGSRIELSGSADATVTAMFTSRVPALQCFELLEPIGAGQFGRVWRARDTELERFVAVKIPHRKILTGEDAGFIVREARAAAQLNHPNLVTVYEVGRHEDTVYIVSEYIDGVALNEWTRHYHPDARESAQLCAQIARALHHAHENNVVHRDLKPGNIVMDTQRQPHITDFGLAKREGGDVTIAVTGQILGTPAYMPPEQIRDGHAADRRSDVYGVGVILYEMLTGKRPFVGGKRVLLQQVLSDDPRPLRAINSTISKDLETICLKAMAKKPEERYATAEAMAEDLDRYLRGEPILARRVSRANRAVRWARRRPAVATAIALSAIVVGLIGTLMLTLSWRPPAYVPGASKTARQVLIATEPSGAQVRLIPLNAHSGKPEPERAIDVGKSPVSAHCEPGNYLVVAYKNDQLFHEVYRYLPPKHVKRSGSYPHLAWKDVDGKIAWPTIRLFSTAEVIGNMTRVEGGSFVMRAMDPDCECDVVIPSFYVDSNEVTFGQLESARLKMPNKFQGETPPADMPVHNVTWDEAIVYAERLGKRLPREEAFQYVVTQAGTRLTPEGWQTDLENVPLPETSKTLDQIEWEALDKPVRGMRSNVLEWTVNWFTGSDIGAKQRIVRGGFTFSATETNPVTDRNGLPPRLFRPLYKPSQRLGFRCVRSLRPSLHKEDLVQLTAIAEEHPPLNPAIR